MLLAADYPFLNIFWTMILFFFWVAWIWVLVGVITDLFRRRDASGWVKAMWTICLILIPFAGVLGYLIVNGSGMGDRSVKQLEANQARYAANGSINGGGAAGEIEKAKGLLDSGAISAVEYDSLKAKALA
jgi:hypothetical protein